MSRTVLSAGAVAQELIELAMSAHGGKLVTGSSMEAKEVDQDVAVFEVDASMPERKGGPHGQPVAMARYKIVVTRFVYQDPAEDE